MPRRVATDRSFRQRRLTRTIGALILIAGIMSGTALPAQSSPVCEFSVATVAATQIELSSARKSYRACARDSRNSCKIELARVRDLQLRMKLARDYLDRYCMR